MSADSVRKKEKRHRRVIDVVYEPDASNSIEGADKLNREISTALWEEGPCSSYTDTYNVVAFRVGDLLLSVRCRDKRDC